MILFAGLFLLSGWKVWELIQTYQEGTNTYTQLEQYATFEETQPTQEPEAESETQEAASTPPPLADFDALSAINDEIVGWIYIPDTTIHYPVVQGADNNYYLTHLFDGTKNSSGSIFLDYRCAADFSSSHSILYGHHMKNGSMFAGLTAYKEQDFYDNHPTGWLSTPAGDYEIRFFSGYVASNKDIAWNLNLNQQNLPRWLTEVGEKSCFQSSQIPSPTDSILTLSTCTYEFNDAKFVLHGFLVPAH